MHKVTYPIGGKLFTNTKPMPMPIQQLFLVISKQPGLRLRLSSLLFGCEVRLREDYRLLYML